jgi:hypothetical protein
VDSNLDAEIDQELARMEGLTDLFLGDHGEYEGVYFDFRHELIPPGEWVCPVPESEGTTLADPDLPLIWYPWFGDWKTRVCHCEPPKQNLKNVGRSFAKRSAACFVEAGDKVEIDHVEKKETGDLFEHAHDAEIILAFLKITRKDGTFTNVIDPLVYRGFNSILSTSDKLNVVENIQARICNHFNLKSIRAKKQIKADNSYAYRSLEQARELARHGPSRRRTDRTRLSGLRGRAANPVAAPEGGDGRQEGAVNRLSAQSRALPELS